MRKYRLLCANPETGHLELISNFERSTDQSAIRDADALRDGRAAELWRSYRVVKAWKAD